MNCKTAIALATLSFLTACSDNNPTQSEDPSPVAEAPAAVEAPPTVTTNPLDTEVPLAIDGNNVTLPRPGNLYRLVVASESTSGPPVVLYEGTDPVITVPDGSYILFDLTTGEELGSVQVGLVAVVPAPDESDAVSFTTDGWRLTAIASNEAMNLSELSAIREFVERVFPLQTPNPGVIEKQCDSGSARAEVSDDISVYTFVNCVQNSLTMTGQYSVIADEQRTGNVVKNKLDEDFIALSLSDDTGTFMISLQGDSKHQVTTTDVDSCGFVKIEDVLRQDFAEAQTLKWRASNLAREDIVTTDQLNGGDEEPCGLQTSTLAVSGSASVEVTLPNSVQINGVNRNGKLIQRIHDGMFISADDPDVVPGNGFRNVLLSIYNSDSDSSLAVYQINLTEAQVRINPAESDQIIFTAPFTVM
ncbi:MAG: hypothetical protein AB8B97_01415 [Granulosicoccus sp.]